jgi:ABC-type enterochelin transport system permease subunit
MILKTACFLLMIPIMGLVFIGIFEAFLRFLTYRGERRWNVRKDKEGGDKKV